MNERPAGLQSQDLALSLQGGVKVLITGPWTEAAEHYSCVFDHIAVPASLVQPGVLRCYCPGTGVGVPRVGADLWAREPHAPTQAQESAVCQKSRLWRKQSSPEQTGSLGEISFLRSVASLLGGQAFERVGLHCRSRPSGCLESVSSSSAGRSRSMRRETHWSPLISLGLKDIVS